MKSQFPPEFDPQKRNTLRAAAAISGDWALSKGVVLVPAAIGLAGATKDAHAIGLAILFWKIAAAFGLAQGASMLWNSLSSRTKDASEFKPLARMQPIDDDVFNDPDYLDRQVFSGADGPLTYSANDAMHQKVFGTQGLADAGKLNRMEGILLSASYQKQGDAFLPVTTRRAPESSPSLARTVAEMAGRDAEFCYYRMCKPTNPRAGSPRGYVTAVYVTPQKSEIGMITYPDQKLIASRDLQVVSWLA